jgi:calcineurin-like phosphoesterase family protein/cellulose/xylan binding protein with CBM9 domain
MNRPSYHNSVTPLAVLAGFAVLLMVFSACDATEPAPSPNAPTLRLGGSPPDKADFHFGILSDRTGGERAGIFDHAITRMNLLRPDFVMCVGDLIEGYSEDEQLVAGQWKDLIEKVNRLKMPFFPTAGNHDITNALMAKMWEKRFGAPFYHFVYGDCLFLVLCTQDPEGTEITQRQMEYVDRALAGAGDVRWTFVFFHHPLWVNNERWWPILAEKLGDRQYTVFTGHLHNYMHGERNGQRMMVLATTGGASQVTGPETGQFDHVVWVTMTPEGPVIANLTLDGIFDEWIIREKDKKAQEAFRSGGVLRLRPIVMDGPRLERAELLVDLSNPTESPIALEAEWVAPPGVKLSDKALSCKLAPGAKRDLRVAIEANPPVEVESLAPIEIRWKAEMHQDDGTSSKASGMQRIGIVRPLPVARRSAPVAIDGKLDDWDDLPFACERPAEIKFDPATWEGPEDGSFRFAVAHDSEFAYVAVRVTDDKRVFDSNTHPWSQDGIEIRFDARPVDQQDGTGEGRGFCLVAMSPGETPENMVLFQPAHLPKGTKAVCVRSEGGFVAEVAIPIEYLDRMQAEPWKYFRLNIAVDDYDDPATPGAQLWWQTDWRSPGTYRGSGLFCR